MKVLIGFLAILGFCSAITTLLCLMLLFFAGRAVRREEEGIWGSHKKMEHIT